MVCSHDHAFGHAGDTVLRFHSLTGFLVAANKVAQLNTRFSQRLLAGQHRAFDIDRQHAVGLDKFDGILAILLIGLDAIRQAHGDKLQAAIAAFSPQLIDRHLAQFAGKGRILAAANAEHQ